jgi:hypothetical protein
MLSEQIHCALAQGHNRFEICQLVSKGVRHTHKPGERFEDSIGDVLGHLGSHPSVVIRVPGSPKDVSPKSAEPSVSRAADYPNQKGTPVTVVV